MRRSALVVAVVAALVLPFVIGVAQASATTLQKLSTATQPIQTPEMADCGDPFVGYNQGWYSSEFGRTDECLNNTNYITGRDGIAPNDYYGETRGFFSFWMGRVSGRVSAAKLVIPRGNCPDAQGDDVVETLNVWNVSTDAVTLNDGLEPGPSPNTFADLGSGTKFASKQVSTVQGSTMTPNVAVQLNSAAITAINQARGKNYLSFGMALSTLTHDAPEEVFGCTGLLPVNLSLTIG
jgi:hypothetical protein